jgi:hypothetical protein
MAAGGQLCAAGAQIPLYACRELAMCLLILSAHVTRFSKLVRSRADLLNYMPVSVVPILLLFYRQFVSVHSLTT